MIVHDTLSFNGLIEKLCDYDLIVFANECEKDEVLNSFKVKESKKIAIIVGSEGGFSEEEINLIKNANGDSISLGKRILRAETAAIALTAVIMYLSGEWDYE